MTGASVLRWLRDRVHRREGRGEGRPPVDSIADPWSVNATVADRRSPAAPMRRWGQSWAVQRLMVLRNFLAFWEC